MLQQYCEEDTGCSLLETNWLLLFTLTTQGSNGASKAPLMVNQLAWSLSELGDAPLGESGGYFLQGLTKQRRPSPSGQPRYKQVWETEHGCFLSILAPCLWVCPLYCCFQSLLTPHPGFFSFPQVSSRPLAPDWDCRGVLLNRLSSFRFSALSGMQTAIIRLLRLYCASQFY